MREKVTGENQTKQLVSVNSNLYRWAKKVTKNMICNEKSENIAILFCNVAIQYKQVNEICNFFSEIAPNKK